VSDLTDTDLSRLITLVVIPDGESSSMHRESAKRLEARGLLNIAEMDHHPEGHFVTDTGRALVARMLAAGEDTMKFYIQQSALARIERIDHRMDSTGKTMAQISIDPAKGFVEVGSAVPRCKTCRRYSPPDGEACRYGYCRVNDSEEMAVPPDGSGHCHRHTEGKP